MCHSVVEEGTAIPHTINKPADQPDDDGVVTIFIEDFVGAPRRPDVVADGLLPAPQAAGSQVGIEDDGVDELLTSINT